MLTTRPTGLKEYKVVDHLGSTRAIVSSSGSVIGTYDNEPFGAPLAVTGVESRKGFIDKETDQETSTGNFGVRQYDAATGRFTSVDPLWEEYPSQTPYHYSCNNPLLLKDPNGENPVIGVIVAVAEVAATVYDVADAVTTLFDENASALEKGMTVVGAGIGLVAPGGGYGKAAREGTKVIDNAISSLSKVIKSADDVADATKAGSKVAKAADNAMSPGSGVLRRTNGETAATVRGKEMHKWWDYGEGYKKDVVLPSGKRPDAVDFEKRHVIELKPNNPKAIKRGEKQVEGYRRELQANDPHPNSKWTASVVTYD